MAKARIGHFAEAQVLEALGVDYVDESEVLTPADEAHHIDKWAFITFVRGHQPGRGPAPHQRGGGLAIRSKGEAGTGNIVEAVRHLRSILGDIRKDQADSAELYEWAKRLQSPIGLVQEVAETGTLPVPLFCAGGIATPAGGPGHAAGAQATSWARASSRGRPTRGQGHRRGDGPLRRARHHRQGQPGPGHRHAGRGDLDLDVKLARGW